MTTDTKGNGCTCGDAAINAKWEIAREIIRNENQLVSDRMTYFLTLQGFLFTALVVGSSAFANDASRDYRLLLLFVLCAVCCLGFVSPRLLSPALRAAFRHIDATKEWWLRYGKDTPTDNYRKEHPFPVLIGRRANAYGFFLFWQLRDQDEPYDDLGLDDDAKQRIGMRYDMGVHRVPDFLTWMWGVALLVYLAISGAFAYASLDPTPNSTMTSIQITQDSKTETVRLSYTGDSNRVADLLRRLTAIPGPASQSKQSP